MNSYDLSCPNCSQRICSTENMAGCDVTCPNCKHRFTAPTPARAVPPPLPASARTAADDMPPIIGVSEFEKQVMEGGRYVVFQYCFSVLVMTFKRSSPIMHLRADEEGAKHASTWYLNYER